MTPFYSKVKAWSSGLPLLLSAAVVSSVHGFRAEAADPGEKRVPKVPRFSVEYMDRSVDPSVDFFKFANGTWIKNNPIPSDKPRWSGFDELIERNFHLLRDLLETAAASPGEAGTPMRQVGDFYASVMDTNRVEALGFSPIRPLLERVNGVKDLQEYLTLLGELELQGMEALFGTSVFADLKNSTVYAFYFSQGGLGLPDRDYYLAEGFAKQREAYVEHMVKMFGLLGDPETASRTQAKTVLELETALAKVCKPRVELRDPNKNYHRFTAKAWLEKHPGVPFAGYLAATGLTGLEEFVVGQPEFFAGLEPLLRDRPLAEWKTYLRWHIVRKSARYLHSAAEAEAFAFYGTVLNGQPEQEPRWRKASSVIDGMIGEALGAAYVQRYFPETARTRMRQLIDDLKVVFRGRLQKLEWMTDATRGKALAKFERFTQKIGHPEKFRDYSNVVIRRDDLFGNVLRASAFEVRRQLDRIGKPVDRSEWGMTPQTVNAYANPTQNEIVFPAAILQPPFFDTEMDDAVNYGGIGFVIGHEMTHHFDDQGRKFDAEGNLQEWWSEADAKAFEARAQKLIDQYNGYEALPGAKVNGRLALGENIADLGGLSMSFEALQRALERDPSKRKNIDGFTPEQRFFLSASQIWRIHWREAALRRQLTVGPHSPGQFRAIGPHVNMQEFFDAFGIKPGTPMWRDVSVRAKIW